ncbi:uncharacterized protein C8Q71DRAFT_726332 [Rhodofomes roseus]|uniref:Uncharacterized protein n=1 Tax=Rhodofomes roseus TaxID=34475 RepID=A0ABQ8K593_9APHY|nr:uncharacterized protein C8Q71DRAFT_726332 [Rhodofomes roseus]KAH9832162.1 hypothetical protein C8Q71DRAFT_726332 [Rhodofomes roseus]
MGDGTGGCWRRWRRRGWWEDGSGEGNLGVAGSGDWAPGATSCLEPSHSHSARTARPPPRYSPAADPNALNSPCAALALAQLLTDNEAAKTRVFWEVKNVATERFIDVYDEADMPAEKLDDKAREHMSDASEAWARVRDVLAQLNQEIIVPYTLGGTLADDGTVAIGKLQAHVGEPGGGRGWRRAGLTVPDPESRERQNRLAAFWDAVRERLKEMYPSGTRLIVGDLAVFMSSIAAIKVGGHADTEVGEKKDNTRQMGVAGRVGRADAVFARVMAGRYYAECRYLIL